MNRMPQAAPLRRHSRGRAAVWMVLLPVVLAGVASGGSTVPSIGNAQSIWRWTSWLDAVTGPPWAIATLIMTGDDHSQLGSGKT